MATWGIEIMRLANDFCLNTAKAKEIVRNVENMSVPNNVNNEDTWRYDKAHSMIVPMIMSI